MTVDILMLTLLLRYSGGVENPMLMFYLFHVLIATLLLRPINALLQGVWALLAFGGLAVGQCADLLGHDAFLPPETSGVQHANWLMVFAATGVLAVGIVGTLVFTLQISSRLDEQERRLRATIDALERSRDAIQDLQARRSRFMLTAAHQLKSPLAGVQTLTGLIHDGVVPADSVRPTCARIIERCRDAIQQVGELLTLSRIQDSAPRQSGDGADVGVVLRELADRYELIAAEKGVALSCEFPTSGALRVGVDSANFADCIGNLIDNAIKYTPAGGRASVSATKVATLDGQPISGDEPGAGGFVCVTVSDSGIGISPSVLSVAAAPDGEGSVFDAFIRGDNALAAGISGSGLGLAIVREVVEHARGRISVTSHPGVGTTFRVTMPTAGVDSMPGTGDDVAPDTRTSVVVVTA
jgi:signal transduction histidine kinase